MSGRAAAGLAVRRGDSVTVYDADPAAGQDLLSAGISVVGGDWSGDLLDGMDVVVTSPGLPERSQPIIDAIESRLPVWSELEYGSHSLSAPVVAITGTNGKTTVTGLVAAMLAETGYHTVAAGNIGTALSEVADRDWDTVVVEASSFQLRFIESFRPAVAVVLNIADDHLDWHGSRANYVAAKARILENQTADDVYVFDMDDETAALLAVDVPSRTIGVSGLAVESDGIGRRGDYFSTGHTRVPLADLSVADRAYLLDLAAACAAAGCAGASPAAIEHVVREFTPGQHRRTVVGVIDGVAYIDDSKGTNPHASLAAVEAYPSVVLIAGGRNKGLDLGPLAQAPNIRHLIALGEAAGELEAAAIGPHTRAGSLEEAITVAHSIARPGDVVLLSPGCASFDMFENYQARGEVFADCVRRLGQHEEAS